MSTALAKDPAVEPLEPTGTTLPQTLQTIMPAVVTPYTQTIVTDIDGDGLNEVIVFDQSLQQLAVVHQFKYTDFTLSEISPTVWPNSNSPIWTSDTNPHWMTIWDAQGGKVPGDWTIDPGDVVLPADLDGDGILELFIYNLTTSKYGILKWQTTTNEFQTIYKTSHISNIGVYGSQYFVVPNIHSIVSAAPANAAGILYYNPLSKQMGMGMFYYSGSAFVPAWNFLGQQLPNNSWNLAASVPPTNAFCPGFFTAAGTPSVVVLDNQDQYIALLTWNGSAFLAPFGGQNPTVGGWRINAGDQMLGADFDGDGLTEILIYNPGTGYLGILKWNVSSSNFESLVVTNGTITTGQFSFTINSNNSFYVLPSLQGAPARIVAYSSDPVNVALLSYSSGKFVCQWSGSALAPSNGWQVSGKDSFYIGTPSATPPMFTISNQGANAEVPTLGAVAVTATGLQVVSNQTIPVQSWSPAFVVNAPTTSFPPFQTGNQAAIYTYISNLFPVPGQSGGPNQPVRTLYTNQTYSGKFQSYANALSAVPTLAQIPSNWPVPAPGWSNSDWAAVMNTIVTECNQVDTVYALYKELGSLAGGLNAFQIIDFNTVKQNIQGISTITPTEFDYWGGETLVGALWVLAAGTAFIPGNPFSPAAFGLSIFFTIAGSAVSAGLGYNPTEEVSMAFDDVEHTITETLAASFVQNSLDLTAFLGDPVKLTICGGLSANEWEIPTELPSTMQQPFQERDRLWMYEQLLPAYITIIMMLPGQSPVEPLYVGNGVAYYFNTSVTREQFLASAFYKDLFHTLNVSKEAFFSGLGAWAAIPRTIVSP